MFASKTRLPCTLGMKDDSWEVFQMSENVIGSHDLWF